MGFQGYYVEVREGEDAVRAYRKIKRWIKEDKFIDQIRANNTYQKPSEIKREKQSRRMRTRLRQRRRMRRQGWAGMMRCVCFAGVCVGVVGARFP